MKPAKYILLLLALCCTALAQAQIAEGNIAKRKALMMGLYPPDMIMRHQQRLGISDQQRREITDAVKRFQSEVADLQWDLQGEQQDLKQILAGHPIPLDDTLTKVEGVLNAESEFKQAHFRLLITIKNVLTADQVAQIEENLARRRKQSAISN